MADDPDESAERRRIRARRDELRGLLPDTPGHRERMARLREDRKQLVAMVPIAKLRTALDIACAGCGSPDHDSDVDRSARGVAHAIVRAWTLFCADLRTLTRELHEEPSDAPVSADGCWAIDVTLFRPLDLPDRISKAQLHHAQGATTWRAFLRALLEPAFAVLPEDATVSMDEIIDGFTEHLRTAVDANGGTLRIFGWVITKTERGYDITNDMPPPPASAS